MSLLIILSCTTLVLFVTNVLAIAMSLPWWVRPFTVLITLGDHGTTLVRWLATHIANFFIWIASWMKEVLERLAPAIKESIEDGVQAVWGTAPTWLIEFWNVFCTTIMAAYDIVAPWITWIVIGVCAALCFAVLYYVLFVWTKKGKEWIAKLDGWLRRKLNMPPDDNGQGHPPIVHTRRQAIAIALQHAHETGAAAAALSPERASSPSSVDHPPPQQVVSQDRWDSTAAAPRSRRAGGGGIGSRV